MLKRIFDTLSQIVPVEELEGKVFWRTFGVISWVSFMFAGLATMLFFATFSPVELIRLTTFDVTLSSEAIYTISFFLFWLLCSMCSSLTYIMLSLPLHKRQKEMPE